MNSILLILGVILVLMAVHELSHLAMAKLLGLKVLKVGFATKPFVHVYVSVSEYNVSNLQRIFFLLIGNWVSGTLFLILYFLTDLFEYRWLYYGFVVQILLETNPMYSDYTKLIIYFKTQERMRSAIRDGVQSLSKEEVRQLIEKENSNYLYSKEWYLHFFIWGMLAVLCLSPLFLL